MFRTGPDAAGLVCFARPTIADAPAVPTLE